MFLYYYLYYYYRLYSKIVLYIASSSIIALLLPSSYTTYSYFWIPINLCKESTYNISKNLNLAKLLRRISLLI
jgi:PIF1-like helicase